MERKQGGQGGSRSAPPGPQLSCGRPQPPAKREKARGDAVRKANRQVPPRLVQPRPHHVWPHAVAGDEAVLLVLHHSGEGNSVCGANWQRKNGKVRTCRRRGMAHPPQPPAPPPCPLYSPHPPPHLPDRQPQTPPHPPCSHSWGSGSGWVLLRNWTVTLRPPPRQAHPPATPVRTGR